jgi:YihY family inner membrane protein
MNLIERSVAKLDTYQQKRKSLSFIYGVIKRYSELNAGTLVVQLTYAMFTTIFPLLLLMITVLTLVLAGDAHLKQRLLETTFSQFPLVASQLGSNIHVLRRDSEVALVIGLLVLIYGCTSLAGTGIYAMQQIWAIKQSERLNFIKRLGRGVVFLLVLGFGVGLTTLLSSLGTYGKHNLLIRIAYLILAALVNILIYLAAFRALTPKLVATPDLVSGAIFGGIAWTILQSLGSYIVGHYLKNDNATYGVFGSVLGLVAWLYLGAEITVYSATINYVKRHHLWPRRILESQKQN